MYGFCYGVAYVLCIKLAIYWMKQGGGGGGSPIGTVNCSCPYNDLDAGQTLSLQTLSLVAFVMLFLGPL